MINKGLLQANHIRPQHVNKRSRVRLQYP